MRVSVRVGVRVRIGVRVRVRVSARVRVRARILIPLHVSNRHVGTGKDGRDGTNCFVHAPNQV